MEHLGATAAIDAITDLLPFPEATNNYERLTLLESRLRADDSALFEPAKNALRQLRGSLVCSVHAVCWLLIARWHYYHNEGEAIQECAEHAIEIAEVLGDNGLKARAWKALALSFQATGRPAKAITILVKALECAKAARVDEQTGEILTNLGNTLRNCAQYGSAYECYKASLDVFPSVVAWENLSNLLLLVGDISGGIKAARSGLLLLKSVPTDRNERGLRISLELNLTLLFVATGDLRRASEHAQHASSYANSVGELGERLAKLASLVIDAHDPARADEALNALKQDAQGVVPRSELYRSYRMVTVTALEAAGKPAQALLYLREIAELDLAHQATATTRQLPNDIRTHTILDLDASAAASARAHENSLRIQALRLETAVQDQIERLTTLAIRAELREEEAFSTGEHVFRVARLTELLAEELEYKSEVVNTARLAGLLHDLGKVYVPDQVLVKRSTLNDDEVAFLRRHSDDGANLIESLNVQELKEVANAIRHSHERWDGTGYPSGLRAESIPSVARLVAICDSFDSMTHARPFRPARSFASALNEIEQCAGSQFDPLVSKLFVDLLRRLHRTTDDLDQLLADGAEGSEAVRAQRQLASSLRPKRRTL